MSDNLDAQPGGRLLKLPSELRLLIYGHLFPPCKIDIHAPRHNSWVDVDDARGKNPGLAILTTCRTLYTEAKPVLYENTEFHIRFACSGPDLYMMQVRKHRIYSQLLQDMQGRVRSLLSQARKVSLSILFTDSGLWEDSEKAWFRQLTSELTRLVEAPRLKQLRITFEADENSGPTRHEYAAIRNEFEYVLGVLGGIQCRAVVTTAVHPSLGQTDIKLAKYLDTIVKLQWVDITHEVFSKKLARMSSSLRKLDQEFQNRAAWLAVRNPDCDDLIADLDNLDHICWAHFAHTGDLQIDTAFMKIAGLKDELDCLKLEIASVEHHLEWYSYKSWAHNRKH